MIKRNWTLVLLALVVLGAIASAFFLAGCSPSSPATSVETTIGRGQRLAELNACTDEALEHDAGNAYADECQARVRAKWERIFFDGGTP